MYKIFCDNCGDEMIRNYTAERLKLKKSEGNRFFGEVQLGRDNTWNKGELCLSCLKRLLLEAIEENGNANKLPPAP